jgi:hypothetical protein
MNPSEVPAEMWVGVFLPLLLAIVMQWHWTRGARTLVGVVGCALAAFVMHAADISDMHTFLASLLSIMTTAAVFYRAYWLPAGVAPAIEKATTITVPKGRVHPDANDGSSSTYGA